MPLRPPAGFISAFYDPLRNPNAPTIGTATGGDASASVAFTPPSNVGGSAISSYTAISSPGALTGSAASSPVTVSGLSNGTAYTFAVWATNTYGPSAFSAASNSVTPAAAIALFAGGYSGDSVNIIDRLSLTTQGNATDFGDLTQKTFGLSCGGGASSTRGVWGGGSITGGNRTNVIQYVTIATDGNASDFGDLLLAVDNTPAGLSNSTRAIFAGGQD